MSRGRPPRQACKEACASALHWGMVLDAAGVDGSRIDFILFLGERSIFVRVKRSHSRISSTGELVVRFSSEIAELRKIPQTPVVSRELWILLPWGAWQYFDISGETVTEIDDDTRKISGSRKDPLLVPDEREAMAISPGTAESGAGPDEPGSLSPEVPGSRG